MKMYLDVNGVSYEVIRLLGHGKGGYSYLVKRDGEAFVIKKIHHEPCDYYTFGNKIEAEQNDYEKLRETQIPIPKMLDIDVGNERILKEYIEGPTIFELVCDGKVQEDYLTQVREIAGLAQQAGLNIDYFPTNFVVRDEKLYYIDFECNEYMQQWDFEHWGIQYWSRTQAFEDYLNKI